MTTFKKTKISKAHASENLKAFRKEIRDKAWQRVSDSKIPDLVKVAMLMANSLNLLTVQIDRMVRAEMAAMGVSCKASGGDGDIIRGLRNYSDKVKAAMYWFERDLQNFITDSTFDSYGVKAYDNFNRSSAEVIQLLMLAADRGQTDDGMAKVFRVVHRLKNGTMFSDADIERFDFKG